MSFFNSMNVSATGMTAQRLRMDTISQNIANINTTRGANGLPYRRKTVLFQEIQNSSLGTRSVGTVGRKGEFNTILNEYLSDYSQQGGVRVTKVVEDQSPFVRTYDPTHPDADGEGYVSMPNVNTIEEMTNLISANRSYEANVTAFNATKGMVSSALNIGR